MVIHVENYIICSIEAALCIKEYNKLLNAFPTSLIKIIAKYKEKTYFENK